MNQIANQNLDDDDFAQATEATTPEDADERRRTPTHQTRDALKPSAEKVHQEAKDIQWTPPMTLDAPPPRPGYSQRWIRAIVGPDHDLKNWSRKMREGWQPRDPATLPAEYVSLPTSKMTQGGWKGGVIMIEGMVLCEIPLERKRVRDKYYADKTQRLMDAVDSDLDKVQRQGGIRIRQAVRSTAKTGPHAAMADRDDDRDV